MKIKVTEWDIKNGETEDIELCPIALAIQRTLKINCCRVIPSIDRGIIELDEEDGTRQIPLPEEANRFAFSFDNGDPVSPFEFELA